MSRKGVRGMEAEIEMVEVLEQFVVQVVREMQTRTTSPEELVALAELVQAVNQSPRTVEIFDLKELVSVFTSTTND